MSGLPTTKIEFKSPVSTATPRAERGVLAIVVQDGTGSFNYKEYAVATDVDASDYTAANYAIIMRAFEAAPYKVIVVRIAAAGTVANATAILDNLSYDWLCSPASGLQSGLVTYVKAQNTPARARRIKLVATGAGSVDDMHIVNVANTNVKLVGESSTTDMVAYLPRIAGILAACPLNQSVTSYELTDLADVAAVSNLDTSISSGNLCLYRDDSTIRIARGVNTLQTVGGTSNHTEDMKKICVVEGLDITQFEIVTLFKRDYQGKKKNSADNQAILVGDLLQIFGLLTTDEVLDSYSKPSVEVNVAAMRQAWASAGIDVTGLTDAQVKNKTYGSQVFLTATGLKYLDAIEDLSIEIQLG